MSWNGDGAEPRNNAVGRWVSGSFWVLSAEITRTRVLGVNAAAGGPAGGRQMAERRDRSDGGYG